MAICKPRLHLSDGNDHATLRRDVFEYIETGHNRIRRRSTLAYISPEAFKALNIA